VQDIAKGPDGCDPYAFVAGDEGVYFSADDHVHGRELWITDGSEAGTLLIADVRPGAASSGPYNIVPCLGGGVLFSADDGLHGEELWHARLGAEGWQAQLVEDVYPGPASSEPFGLCWEGPTVGVFSATAPEIGRELYLVRINDGQPKIELYDDLYLKTY
jgi:ELWxxDGT repeat protein